MKHVAIKRNAAPPSPRVRGPAPAARMARGVVAGEPRSAYLRPLLNLFAGVPGARNWKRTISERGYGRNASPDVLVLALDAIESVWKRSSHRLDDHTAFRSRR